MEIVRLVDRPDLLPQLARGYRAEWPVWYGPRGRADAEADLTQRLRSDGLPLGLVAVDGETAVGAVALAERSIDSHAHLAPWLIGLWVAPDRRGNGLGALLIRAAADEAGRQGVQRLYAGTATAVSLFEREGWTMIARGRDRRHDACVFAIDLQG